MFKMSCVLVCALCGGQVKTRCLECGEYIYEQLHIG
jgi:hypothetical protein